MVTFTGYHHADGTTTHLERLAIVKSLDIVGDIEDMTEPTMAGIFKMDRKYPGCSMVVDKHLVYAFFSKTQRICFDNMSHLESEFRKYI